MEQWTIGNETYAVSLDDPEDALGRGYGIPTPIAFDLEWYATAVEQRLDAQPDMSTGYEQAGVVHGSIEILGEPAVELTEAPACRWHRWTTGDDMPLGQLVLSTAVAHSGVRAPFRFPDGGESDLVLTADGWHRRATT
jgi:hypothetical protein